MGKKRKFTIVIFLQMFLYNIQSDSWNYVFALNEDHGEPIPKSAFGKEGG